MKIAKIGDYLKRTGAQWFALVVVVATACLAPAHAADAGMLGFVLGGFIVQQAPTFLPVAAGQRAICEIPRYQMTLTRLAMSLGGTFTKAQIDRIMVRIGTRAIWEVTGTELDVINGYKGLFSDTKHLTLDFTERDARDIVGVEIGGIDMSKLADNVYIEIDINAGAVSPTLRADMMLTPPQGDDKDQLIKKFIKKASATLAAGRNDITFNAQGALLQRAYLRYTGTDWTTTADGNLSKLQVKKNGVPLWDDIGCLVSRQLQQDYKKVPQSRTYVYDPIADNNQSGAVVTADASSFLIQPTITAGDTITTIFEVLDKPGNL